MENEDQPHVGCVGTQERSAGCADAIGQLAGSEALGSKAGGTGCAPGQLSTSTSEMPNPPQTLREFERALRFLGYSRLQAEHIGRKGFAGLHGHQQDALPTPGPETSQPDQLRQALERLALSLKA